MSAKSMHARLAAVEQRQAEDDGVIAAKAAEFYRRFLRLVEHYQGRDSGPDASLAAEWAADFWHDAEALDALRARAASYHPAGSEL
jgi:hypothetical protein